MKRILNDQANNCLIHFYKRIFKKMPLKDIFKNQLLSDTVFKYLPLPDVKTVALVCKSWRELIECGRFWQGSPSPLPTPILRIRDESIFSSPRIMTVRKFKLDRWTDTDSELVNLFFSFVSKNEDYEVEYLMCNDLLLTTVPTDLATAMCKVVELRLHGLQLSKRQCNYLFRAIGNHSTNLKLKKLVLLNVVMQDLDVETLAMAVANIEEITFGSVDLSEDHWQAIFSAICSKSLLRLREIVFIDYEPISHVRDVEIMAKALCRVQCVGLYECGLRTDQLTVMLTNISRASELQLQTLVLVDESIRGVTPSLLARAVCRLKRCSLVSLRGMTTLHLEKLCVEIVNCKNLSLTQLSMGHMSEIEDVREDILASVVNRLEAVDFGDLTVVQLRAVFNRVIECSDSNLKELFLQSGSRLEETEVNQSVMKKVREKVKIYTNDCLIFIDD